MILPLIDAAVSESQTRAGAWIACRSGCADCCHAAFAITALDARRLREGLAELPPERRAAIQERARSYAARIRFTFPGNWQTGELDLNEEWQEWFFARQRGQACPALAPVTGACELYEHRPVACRLYGHLIQIGDGAPSVCPLCFRGTSPAQREACRVHIDPAAIDDSSFPEGRTIVALALSY